MNSLVNHLSNPLISNDRYKTYTQIKEKKTRNARIVCGLSVDAKGGLKDPSLEYKYNPSMRTRNELLEKTRRTNVLFLLKEYS